MKRLPCRRLSYRVYLIRVCGPIPVRVYLRFCECESPISFDLRCSEHLPVHTFNLHGFSILDFAGKWDCARGQCSSSVISSACMRFLTVWMPSILPSTVSLRGRGACSVRDLHEADAAR